MTPTIGDSKSFWRSIPRREMSFGVAEDFEDSLVCARKRQEGRNSDHLLSARSG